MDLLSVALDGLLALLLLVTIIYAFVLSRRLSVLRSNKMDLEGFIERMNEATRRAEASLQGLKQAANGAKAELDRPLSRAQTLRDELSFLIQRADAMGEKLADQTVGGTGGPSVEPKAATKPKRRPDASRVEARGQSEDAAADDEPRSKAERDLMNALKNVR